MKRGMRKRKEGKKVKGRRMNRRKKKMKPRVKHEAH